MQRASVRSCWARRLACPVSWPHSRLRDWQSLQVGAGGQHFWRCCLAGQPCNLHTYLYRSHQTTNVTPNRPPLRTATVVLFGSAISDPIALLSRIEGVWAIAAALVGLVLATLTTNLAANVVAPSNVSLRGCQASVWRWRLFA